LRPGSKKDKRWHAPQFTLASISPKSSMSSDCQPRSSRQIDVPVNRITAIINGQRGITADTALRLGHWFGTSPEFWLNLQSIYELRRARAEAGARVEKLPRLSARRRRSGGAAAHG
jgi:addiction module HigA family antidote